MKTLIVALLAAFVTSASAQNVQLPPTNTVAYQMIVNAVALVATNTPHVLSAASTDAGSKIASDVSQLAYDIVVEIKSISWTGAASSLFALYLASKGLRNRTSLGQRPLIGSLLNLLNLEPKQVKPASPPNPPVVPANTKGSSI